MSRKQESLQECLSPAIYREAVTFPVPLRSECRVHLCCHASRSSQPRSRGPRYDLINFCARLVRACSAVGRFVVAVMITEQIRVFIYDCVKLKTTEQNEFIYDGCFATDQRRVLSTTRLFCYRAKLSCMYDGWFATEQTEEFYL